MVDIPVWEKYALSVDEAAAYFRIGKNKLWAIIHENKDAPYLLWSGNRVLIKRKLFEDYVDKVSLI